MKIQTPRCASCGKFVSWEKAKRWPGVWEAYMFEPPDDDWLCEACHKDMVEFREKHKHAFYGQG